MTIKENIKYCYQFGIWITFCKTINRFFRDSHSKIAMKINEWNNKQIKKYVRNVCNETIEKYKNKKIILDYEANIKNKGLVNDVIWTMWWQGEENAPEIVTKCIESKRKYANGHDVIVIDKDNYSDYISLPDFIVEKYKKDLISITHFSDIIRLNLLSNYGGAWMDATILVTEPVGDEIFISDFFSLNQNEIKYIGEGKWTTFFMAGKRNNLLFHFARDMHYEYWTKRNSLINYLLFDYIIDIAREEFHFINKMIELSGNTNLNDMELSKQIDNGNGAIDLKLFEKYKEDTRFFKMSWKYPNKEHYTENSELTWYGYIVKE